MRKLSELATLATTATLPLLYLGVDVDKWPLLVLFKISIVFGARNVRPDVPGFFMSLAVTVLYKIP